MIIMAKRIQNNNIIIISMENLKHQSNLFLTLFIVCFFSLIWQINYTQNTSVVGGERVYNHKSTVATETRIKLTE